MRQAGLGVLPGMMFTVQLPYMPGRSQEFMKEVRDTCQARFDFGAKTYYVHEQYIDLFLTAASNYGIINEDVTRALITKANDKLKSRAMEEDDYTILGIAPGAPYNFALYVFNYWKQEFQYTAPYMVWRMEEAVNRIKEGKAREGKKLVNVTEYDWQNSPTNKPDTIAVKSKPESTATTVDIWDEEPID